MTSDGDLAHRLTHPKFVKTKIYEVAIDKPLEPLHQQMISDIGIDLPDGKSQLGLEKIDESHRSWRVIMHEGRNRQIRRTFAVLGYTVTKLHRTNFGNYALDDIKPGQWREVED
jgi:23S rRNA pseudouridine2605 synthase